MEISINTPALLFPAIAILTLGYVNRYLGIANVIRTFKKDYDSGYIHTDLIVQLKILKKRIELARYMISLSIGALMLACVSMLFVFLKYNDAGVVVFAAAVIAMIISTVFSLYETRLSNKSLLIEVDDILDQEANKK